MVLVSTLSLQLILVGFIYGLLLLASISPFYITLGIFLFLAVSSLGIISVMYNVIAKSVMGKIYYFILFTSSISLLIELLYIKMM